MWDTYPLIKKLICLVEVDVYTMPFKKQKIKTLARGLPWKKIKRILDSNFLPPNG